MLPDISGEEICSEIRSRSDVPILMLTAKASEEERVTGLVAGADDYLVKPFSPRELVARVRAVLRRTKAWSRRSCEILASTMAASRSTRSSMPSCVTASPST